MSERKIEKFDQKSPETHAAVEEPSQEDQVGSSGAALSGLLELELTLGVASSIVERRADWPAAEVEATAEGYVLQSPDRR